MLRGTHVFLGLGSAIFLTACATQPAPPLQTAQVVQSRQLGSQPAFIWPTQKAPRVVNSGFGVRVDPLSGRKRYHNGLDIQAPAATPVVATADGVVAFSGWQSGYGHIVIVAHGGGIETAYAHLSKRRVQQGARVVAGQRIGDVGATGRVTAPHLHYEVRRGGTPVNPVAYLPQLHEHINEAVATD